MVGGDEVLHIGGGDQDVRRPLFLQLQEDGGLAHPPVAVEDEDGERGIRGAGPPALQSFQHPAPTDEGLPHRAAAGPLQEGVLHRAQEDFLSDLSTPAGQDLPPAGGDSTDNRSLWRFAVLSRTAQGSQDTNSPPHSRGAQRGTDCVKSRMYFPGDFQKFLQSVHRFRMQVGAWQREMVFCYLNPIDKLPGGCCFKRLMKRPGDTVHFVPIGNMTNSGKCLGCFLQLFIADTPEPPTYGTR
jgi:hypothetical protein